MSAIDTAMSRLKQYVTDKMAMGEPYRSTVASTDGDLVHITRPGASIADAEPAAVVTNDELSEGDEVMVQPVVGKPVVIGKVRRQPSPGRSRPNIVSPLDFGAKGDGTTDDYAAIMAAVDRLGTRGGTLQLGGKRYYSASTIEIDTPITIDGGAYGNQNSGGAVQGGEIKFPLGIDGLIILNTDTNSQSLSRLSLTTTHTSSSTPTAGAGHGLTIKNQTVNLQQIHVRGFQGNGVQILGGTAYPGVNANLGLGVQVKAFYNGGHGIYLHGSDANAWVFIAPNVGVNGGYGIFNDALYHNTFLTPHAINNVTGDYYDDGWGSHWLNPYAELGGKFVFGTNARGVRVDANGFNDDLIAPDGAPTFWYTSAYQVGVHTVAATTLNTNNCVIISNGAYITDLRQVTPAGTEYRWRADGIAAGSLELRNVTDGINLISMGRGGGAGSLAFFGKTPTTQPAANPDTSGATLAALETEVNQLKAALRSLGLIAT